MYYFTLPHHPFGVRHLTGNVFVLVRLDLNQRPPVYRTGATDRAELRTRNI